MITTKDGVRALPDRILERLDVDQDGCWLWTRSTKEGRYGQAWWKDRMVRVHKITYQVLIGPIGDGLELDHLCCNTMCANPYHLEQVTHAENMRRYGDNLETCRKGHDRTTHGYEYVGPTRHFWVCRECKRLSR